MLHTYVEPSLRAALASINAPSDTNVVFEIPRQQGQGHLSTTVAMALAKSMRGNPRAIAQSLVDAMGKVPFVQTLEIAGPGFINVTFEDAVFHDMLRQLTSLGDAIGRSDIGGKRTVNVEYVSANPTGPLHAGHGRNCAVGDTIANLLSWCGYDVTREYYFNNAGNQMNKLGESVDARVRHRLGEPSFPFPEDGYHGEYIHAIADDIVATRLDEYVSLNDAERRAFCRRAGEQWCFGLIKRTLESLNIRHDVFFNEDSLYAEGKIASTIQALRDRGVVYEKDGATWLALSQMGQPQDKVIVKSSGEPTYRLPDIAYHFAKLQHGYDMLVDIFGADHIATIPDVLAGVTALGQDASKVRVVIHQMVTFVENGDVVKFSKRSGKSFTLDELIDEVGADVVRFFFVMRAVGTHLEFDLGLAKEEGDKNPVFYLQYAHARIASILRKAAEQGIAVDDAANLDVLRHPREIELIVLLSRFRHVVERAAESLEPHTVAEYLRDVAAAYHNFYHDCRILGSEGDLQGARLLLADVTRRAMRNGLVLLGVAAPDVM